MSKGRKISRIKWEAEKRALQKRMIYYWAYGSNLNVNQMRLRCPGAVQVSPLILEDGMLVFRNVADVTAIRGRKIAGGLWKITPEHEATLDKNEGVASRWYLKRYILIEVDGKKHDCLFYQMRISTGIMPPTEAYLDCIIQGYRDFNLDLNLLDAALHESWSNKQLTPLLRERHSRRGSPRLARYGESYGHNGFKLDEDELR